MEPNIEKTAPRPFKRGDRVQWMKVSGSYRRGFSFSTKRGVVSDVVEDKVFVKTSSNEHVSLNATDVRHEHDPSPVTDVFDALVKEANKQPNP